MIEPIDNPLVDQLVETGQTTRLWRSSAFDRDQHDVVVPMTIRIITFTERSPIFLRRELISMKSVGSAKPIAPRHVYL
jgi:hypothetical protein